MAKYWLAKYIEDLFRQEPRNIGVIVSFEGQFAAQFFGETQPGHIDRRKLRALPYPDVYTQWIEYWRAGIGNPEQLVASSKGNFQVVRGGDVSGVHEDATTVVRYLYSLLVADDGFRHAVLEDQGEVASTTLEAEIAHAFTEIQVTADQGKDLFIAHPIRRRESVRGAQLEHKPAFSQVNGHLYVMETVDFTTPQKKRASDHAGSVAYMFRDIRDGDKNSERFSLIRYQEADLENEDVAYALKALRNESDVVNWGATEAREGFLRDRRAVAMR